MACRAILSPVWIKNSFNQREKTAVCEPPVIDFCKDELGTEAPDEKDACHDKTDPVNTAKFAAALFVGRKPAVQNK